MDSNASSHPSDINFDPLPSPQPSLESPEPSPYSSTPNALIEIEAEEADEASDGDETSDEDDVFEEVVGSQEDFDPYPTAAVHILMLEQEKRRLTAALKRALHIRNGALRARERRCDHFDCRMEESQREVTNWKILWYHCCCHTVEIGDFPAMKVCQTRVTRNEPRHCCRSTACQTRVPR